MPNFRVPPFLKRDGESLLYNGEGQLIYAVPEEYFVARVAEEYGSYYAILGIFNYVQTNKSGGKVGKTRAFDFPTRFLCKPSTTEKKVSGVEMNKKFGGFEDDVQYRLLFFNKGDQVVQSVHIPEQIENTEDFFRLLFIVARISNTIPYDKVHEYIKENINLSGNDYNITAQMLGIISSEIFRDKDDISIPFRNGKNIDKDMKAYKAISVLKTPNYIDPFVSITSQYWDESLMSAIMMSEDNINKDSPLEKIMMN
jgi:hypothetical protein